MRIVSLICDKMRPGAIFEIHKGYVSERLFIVGALCMGMRGFDSLDEAAEHSAVVKVVNEHTIKVQSYGNCTFFKYLHRGDLRVGNISTYPEDNCLKVNLK